jgi:hypothetical protein
MAGKGARHDHGHAVVAFANEFIGIAFAQLPWVHVSEI